MAASSSTGHGVSSRSSHSAAAGLITDSANPCSQSRISTRSSPSSREKAAGLSSLMLPKSNIYPGLREAARP